MNCGCVAIVNESFDCVCRDRWLAGFCQRKTERHTPKKKTMHRKDKYDDICVNSINGKMEANFRYLANDRNACMFMWMLKIHKIMTICLLLFRILVYLWKRRWNNICCFRMWCCVAALKGNDEESNKTWIVSLFCRLQHS